MQELSCLLIKLSCDSFLPLLKGESDTKLNERTLLASIYLRAYLKPNENPKSRDPLLNSTWNSDSPWKWKLHHYFEDDGVELYDIKSDRSEKNDLSKEYPELVSKLRAKLDAWRKNWSFHSDGIKSGF